MSVYVTDEVKVLQGRMKFVCNKLIELKLNTCIIDYVEDLQH